MQRDDVFKCVWSKKIKQAILICVSMSLASGLREPMGGWMILNFLPRPLSLSGCDPGTRNIMGTIELQSVQSPTKTVNQVFLWFFLDSLKPPGAVARRSPDIGVKVGDFQWFSLKGSLVDLVDAALVLNDGPFVGGLPTFPLIVCDKFKQLQPLNTKTSPL